MQQPQRQPARLSSSGQARFEVRGSASSASSAGNSANASPAPSPPALASGASPFGLAFGGSSSSQQQTTQHPPTAASRRRNSAAAQAVALAVSSSEHARLKKQLDMRSVDLLFAGALPAPESTATPRGSMLSVQSASRPGPTPFYAATNTFAGEDALHSSNASFNQQLRKVQEKLREQTREQRRNAAAAANMQQQQQQLQPEESYTARLLQRDRAEFNAPFHTRASPIPQYFSSASASAQAAAAAGMSTHAHPALHSSSSSLLPPAFPVSARSQPQQHQQPRHPSQPAVSAPPHVRPHAVPRRHHDWRSHVSATSSEDSGDSEEEASAISAAAQRRHVIGGSTAARTHSLHVTGQSSLQPQSAQSNQTLSRSRSALDASLTAASPSPPAAGSLAPSPSPILPLSRQRSSASSPVPRPIAPALQPPPLPLSPPRASLWPLVPQTGTHFPMALARPQHLSVVPTYLEALAPVGSERDRAALVRRLRAADEAKAARQQLVGCNVVYDSIDPNPEHQPLQPQQPSQPLIVGNGPLDLTSAAMASSPVAPPRLSAAALAAWRAPAGELPPYYIPASPSDSTLVFESRFESGNLRRAIQVRPFEYDLLVRPDVNTEKYAQWFYFSVRNTRSFMQPTQPQPQATPQQGPSAFGLSPAPSPSPSPPPHAPQQQPQHIIYKFNLVNLQKSDSLYNAGMQICVYSKRKSAQSAAQGRHVPYTHCPYHCSSNNGSNHGSSSGAAAHDGQDTDEVAFLPPTAPGAIGWHRGCFDICWYKSGNGGGKRGAAGSYTLSFSWASEFEHDTVFFAMAVPYTLTQLYRELDCFGADPRRDCMMRQRVLCRTLAGNDVPLLLITDFNASAAEIAARPAVVFTARVHPGESNASWMMKGIIEYLLSVPASSSSSSSVAANSRSSTSPPDLSQHAALASLLRRRFLFVLVPCLNPDGVVNGNYRCSLAGVDLNRCWLHPDPQMHPTIWATKMLLARLQGKPHVPAASPAAPAGVGSGEEQKSATASSSSPIAEEDVLLSPREVVMFADLHGHSRAPNVFLYGVAAAPAAEEPQQQQQQQPSTSPAASPRSSPRLSPAASPSSSPPPAALPRKLFPAHRLSERVFPRLLSLRSPFFDLDSCNFTVRRSKETTARVVVARELGIANSFTIEASFGGVVSPPPPPPPAAATETNNATAASPSAVASLSRGVMSSSSPSLSASPALSPSPPPAATSSAPVSIPILNPLHHSRYQGFQFTVRMYEEMGWNICAALGDYCDPHRYAQARQEIEAMYPLAAAPSSKAKDAESNAASAPAEDSDDDEADPSAAAELEAALRSKLRVGGGPRKKKKKPRASTATRAAAASDRPESKEAPGSGGGGKKKRRARSKSGERKQRRPSDSGAATAVSSSASTARTHSASLLPAAALHVKRLLERMEAESTAAAAAAVGSAPGVAASDAELSEGELSESAVHPSASAPDLLEAMLVQRGTQLLQQQPPTAEAGSAKLLKSASRVRMAAAAPASFDSASYVAPSSLLLAELPLVAAAKARRSSAKKIGLKKKKTKATVVAAGSSKAS